MSKLKYLFVHCSATPVKFHLSTEHIKQWHLVDAGWSRVGYSDLILRNGSLNNLSPYDQDNEVDYNEMTWGVKGFNGVSRHICLEGGSSDKPYLSPLKTFPSIIPALETYLKYTVLRHPQIKVLGHGDVEPKKPFCPGFAIAEFCQGIGLSEVNIY